MQYDGFVAIISCVIVVPPQAQPDLVVRGAQLSAPSVVAGGSTDASSAVYNQSGAMANSSNMGYYLSANGVLDAGDVLLGSTYGYSIGVGQSSSHYIALTVPAGMAAGSYYPLFVADYQNQVAESDEANNVTAVNFTVTPPSIDLTIQQPSITPSNPAPGTALNMSCYINNQGSLVFPSSSVGFYLSTDQTLVASYVLMTTVTGNALLFVADPINAVAESNEINNVAVLRLTVIQATAIRDQPLATPWAVAPNPSASGQPLLVVLDGAGPVGAAIVELYNVLGQRVHSQPLLLSSGRANRAEVATQGLASGVYTLRLTGIGLSGMRRVLIN